MISTMQRIQQGDMLVSGWVAVLGYGIRNDLCEEGTLSWALDNTNLNVKEEAMEKTT